MDDSVRVAAAGAGPTNLGPRERFWSIVSPVGPRSLESRDTPATECSAPAACRLRAGGDVGDGALRSAAGGCGARHAGVRVDQPGRNR